MGPVSLTTICRFGIVLAAFTLVTGIGQQSAGARGARKPIGVVTSADGVRIAYDTKGEGTPALVFVHGWSCDRSYWQGQLQPFSQHFKVVAVDLAGHGDSGLGREAWTMGAFGADVAAVVQKLGLERIILIGHSMGGDVIVEAARRLKGRVAGLVWVDTYKQLRTSRTPEQVQAFLAPFRANFPETTRTFVRGMFPPTAARALVERVAEDMSSAHPAVALGAMESAITFDGEIPRALQELKLPVVAINPESPPTDLASMKRYGVEVVSMSGVGHFLMMEDPERFNRLLRTTIETIGR
jgi:pimeloyl-ACP methyl ester carboxylesterase